MHRWGMWWTGTSGNLCRRCVCEVHHAGLFADRVAHDDERDVHVDGIAAISPERRAVIAADGQVDLVPGDVLEE